MKITCPTCHKKFDPQFVEGIVPSGRDPDTGEQLFKAEQSCTCPYCNLPVYRDEIDKFEDIELQIEEQKRENREYFDDEQEEE